MKIKLEDQKRLEKQLKSTDRGKVVPVWLPDDEGKNAFTVKNQNRWRRYAELEIYGLFHYKQSESTDSPTVKKAWADYYQMNKLFANRIFEAYNPGDIIIIHDYNLMLLPSLLRQLLPRAYIGFFLHIPFPSREFFRCISRRKELLEGVLGANMIGLQSPSYCRHFSSCCHRILGFEASANGVDVYGAHVAVEAFPIGINAVTTEEAAFHNLDVAKKTTSIRKLFAGKKMIIGRDRLDTVHGVTQKLQAFELFLERYPDWHDKVVLIQITSPSEINTDGHDGASKFLDKISDLTSKINGLCGSLDFTPVQHFPQYLAKEDYYALLQVADVALITSVRDGMNTVSLEYVICQKNNHSPLILSEFSGTSTNLSGAIYVNPWDLGAVAHAINDALCMGREARKTQNEQLYQHVVENNVQNWTDAYIERLLANLETYQHGFCTPLLSREALLTQYSKSTKRLFMFDYDGTLTPIVQDPAAAIPTNRVLHSLTTLASNPKNYVWIISGRDQGFLDKYLGHIQELGLSAEHGCFMRRANQRNWVNMAEKEDMRWQMEVLKIFQRYTEETPGLFLSVTSLFHSTQSC
jgi:trehalose 6-phosphate synthase/phosphatase